ARPLSSGQAGLRPPLPLEAGDRLRTGEFLRRYEAEALLKKAQLIEGIVHMPSPVRASLHAIPDSLIQGWLSFFAAFHPGVESLTNATLLLDSENAPQPDAILCSTPRKGSRVWLNGDGYLCGSPEFVCEVAASSASIDLHEKFRVYRRCGVQEYLVWLTAEDRVLWFELSGEDYVELKPERGFLHSRVFPGLVLDVKALLKRDRARLLTALRAGSD
ncbi:MAG TPA: Uma2 family endonuclease, partial [Verrucomicrobiales bacterium]|nr:Uma2 family endonuclease [Verrucomicrobiales bacterium]